MGSFAKMLKDTSDDSRSGEAARWMETGARSRSASMGVNEMVSQPKFTDKITART